jgi:hypothetical protein
MLYGWMTFKGIPPRSALESAAGRVEWVQDGRYGIKFRLAGAPQLFEYLSKGRAMGPVYDTLVRSDHPVVTVLFDPENAGDSHLVYELSISGQLFRSHEQIARAWMSDERVGGWMGVIFFFAGIFMLYSAVRLDGAKV